MELRLMESVCSDLKKGFVPYEIYSILVEGIEVGRIVLRDGTDEECYYEGHVGYSVFEEFRGHNYAYQACLLLKEKVKLDHLIITCDPHNQISQRIIEKLGCEYVETKCIPISMKKMFTNDEKEKKIYRWKITS